MVFLEIRMSVFSPGSFAFYHKDAGVRICNAFFDKVMLEFIKKPDA